MGILQQGHRKASKLTLASVAEIRRLYAEGYTQGSIAKYAGVTIGTIGRIVRGETWCEGAGERGPTELEVKASEQRAHALMLQIEREKAFEAEAGRAPLMERASPPVVVGAHEQALVSDQAKVTRDRLLGYDSKRASPPPSPLDGGDAPSEGTGEGLAKLEEAAVAESLDVEVALRRSAP